MASSNLSKAQGSGAAINKFTLSMWVKRSVDTAGRLFSATGSSGDVYFRFNGDATMEWSGDASNASSAGYFITNRKFEDYSGWYHLVIRFDSTQGSASNRLRFYVNGVQEESFSSYTDVNSGAVDKINLSGNTHYIGGAASSQYFHGLMSHINYSAGYSYAPTEFGETDSTTGEWKIKTSPSITYGTNGYFILKDGNTLTDSSPNSNNFAVANGAVTKTEDCPSNVFCTFNPLIGLHGAVFGQGNTYFYRTSGGNNRTIPGTIGASSGKYYAEFKIGALMYAGVLPIDGTDVQKTQSGTNNHLGQHSGGYSLGTGQNGAVTYNGGSQTSSGYTWSGTEIIQIALDLDNNKVFIGKNNVWANSSNPENNTGGYSIQSGLTYTFGCTNSNADTAGNFGNGHFQSTAISSAGTNASGNGVFELNVPAGFTALSTKGINS